MFIAPLFAIPKYRSDLVFIDRWVSDVVHSHGGMLLSHREERDPALCHSTAGPDGIVLSEINQTEKAT